MKNKNLILIFGTVLLVLTFLSFAGARDFNIYNTSNSSQSYFIVSGTTGNVGIGTTSPTTKLYVNGSVTATTYYGDGSQLTGVQVKQMIESFVVQGGQSVSAGDVVSSFNGLIKKGVNSSSAYVGIAQASGSAGQTVPVIVGGVADVFSGLTSGVVYYADSNGNLTSGTTSYKVGLAISSSKILLSSDMALNQYFGDMIFANNFRITENWSDIKGLIFKNPTGNSILNLNSLGDLKIPGNIDVNEIYAKGGVVIEENLKVNGYIKSEMARAKPLSSMQSCNVLTEGGIYFNKNDKNFYGCDGNKWRKLKNTIK